MRTSQGLLRDARSASTESRDWRPSALIVAWLLTSDGIFFVSFGARKAEFAPGGMSLAIYVLCQSAACYALAVVQWLKPSRAHRMRNGLPRWPIPLCALTVAVSLGITYTIHGPSQELGTAALYFLAFSLPAIVVGAVVEWDTLKRLPNVLGPLALTLTGAMIVAVLRQSGPSGLSSEQVIQGTGGSNHLTIGVAMGVATVVMAVKAAGGLRLGQLAVYVVGLVCSSSLILLSGSRGPLIAATVAVLGYLIMTRAARYRALMIMILCLALVAVGLSLQSAPSSSHTPLGRFEAALNGSDPSTLERLDYVQDAWRNIVDHPFVGTGVGSFSIAHDRYVYPHNLLLEILNDFGLLGLLVLCLLGFQLCRQVVWHARYGPLGGRIVSALFMFFAVELMFSGSYVTNGPLWLLASMLFIGPPHARTDAGASEMNSASRRIAHARGTASAPLSNPSWNRPRA